jgi:hypothetical protein
MVLVGPLYSVLLEVTSWPAAQVACWSSRVNVDRSHVIGIALSSALATCV